jgi:spore coat protein U-like protein
MALGLVLCSTGLAAAQSCSFSMTDMDFGTIDPTLNQVIDSTGTWTINCTGTPNTVIRICAHICQGSGGMDNSGSSRYMTIGGNSSNSPKLGYNIYADASRKSAWYARTAIPCGTPALNLALTVTRATDIGGSLSITRMAHGRIFSGQSSISSGNYSSFFTANSAPALFRVYYGYLSRGQSCDTLTSNPTNVPFTASATVVPTCRVSASDLNFGTDSLLNSDIAVSSNVSVTCTAGQNYSVGLSQGTTTGGTTTTRLMQHSVSAATVPYELYSDAARTQNWGNSTADDIEGMGTGSAVNHTVYGRVPAHEIAPDAGFYKDTVTVTVTY